MATRVETVFICDRCFQPVKEADHNETGKRLILQAPNDKRKNESFDLCSDCTRQLKEQFLAATELALNK